MAITFNDNMKKVWDYLIKRGMTEAGAAGMMGNMYAESGIIPGRVEILCLKRLKEAGKTYTDESYTAAIDNGAITRDGFLNPLPGKQYGYGLCQWTSPGRKGGLYDLCKFKGVSIADLETQLEWLIAELKRAYGSVWKVLTETRDILSASNQVLIKFEIPLETGNGMQQIRYNYSKEIYDKYSVSATMPKKNIMTEEKAIQKVIDIATGELGYLEKKSNAQLDNKTANAGSGNYTKYWKAVYTAFQGQAWCACFVSWVFMTAFGLETAKKMLKHWPFVYCPTLAGMTTNKTPKVGSIVLFYRNGTYAHTGIVVAVTSTTVTTIEGNTSGASGIIANGGGVCKKTYQRSSLSSLTKFFMPDYSLVSGSVTSNTGSTSKNTSTQPIDTAVEVTEKRAKQAAQGYDKALAGAYKTTADLHIRDGAGTSFTSLGVLPKGTTVQNYGYFTEVSGKKWLYVQTTIGKIKYTGFCSGSYLKK